MSRWIKSTSEPEWAALFSAYTKSAYRLEGQQTYSKPTEDAALRRFLAGQPPGIDLGWVVPKLRAQVAAGRTHTRVRVVVEPPTDYTRLELAVYPELAAAGEDIRIIAIPDGEWPAGLPRHDYWLFDDQDLWRMHYTEEHTFIGAELLDDEAAIAQHLQWRDIALAQALPLQDYLAAQRHDE